MSAKTDQAALQLPSASAIEIPYDGGLPRLALTDQENIFDP
jgi:hypothetical protein